MRKIAGTALRYLKSRGVKRFAFLAPEGERGTAAAQAAVEGLIVADFESDKYRTEKKDREIQSVSLAGFDSGLEANLAAAVEHGRVIAESQNFARDLINEPSNRSRRAFWPRAPRPWPRKRASASKFWTNAASPS